MSGVGDSPAGNGDQERSGPTEEATRIQPRSTGASSGRRPASAEAAGAWSQAGYLQPGQLLGHTYEIEARLARGGMGEVYRARHVELGSRHAIKVILAELANDTRVTEMFAEEARKLRMVRDDAVVAYDGMFRDENGLRYLVMEFVDGVPLTQVIRQGPLSSGQLRHLRDRLAQGLAAAHDKLIYHRDISPDNIILVEGRVELAKIIDFGIAKSASAGDRTIIGSDFAGKYSYVSPEQLGMYGGNVDGRSDIYSLGLVLAACALGEALPMGNSPGTAVEARQRIPDLSKLPEDLRDEIAPLLAPDPVDRPRSMRELPGSWIGSTTLQPASKAVASHKPAKEQDAPKPKKRSAAPIIAGALVGILAVGAAVGYFVMQNPAPSGAPNPPATVGVPASPAEMTASSPPAAPPAPAAPAASENAALPATPTAPPAAPPAPSVAALPPATPAPSPRVDRSEIAARLASALQGFRCADLKTNVAEDLSVRVDGFVSSAADERLVRQNIGTVPGLRHVDTNIAVYGWPHCELVKLLGDSGTLAGGAPPRLEFNNPKLDYRSGDKLIVRATESPGFDGYLYVDYFDNDGNVVHLLPNPRQTGNATKARQVVTLGADGNYEISEPFGPNLVVAISSPVRLFEAARPEAEKAQAYLPALARSLESAGAKSNGRHATSAFSFINTMAR
ncbi:MAG TPA: serine/threonine-protein kinase [Stellaceae bacterium]|nr:serine/threonine-protein kinase [Stellaceae bacterium]